MLQLLTTLEIEYVRVSRLQWRLLSDVCVLNFAWKNVSLQKYRVLSIRILAKKRYCPYIYVTRRIR